LTQWFVRAVVVFKEIIKSSPVAEVVKTFGISVAEVVKTFGISVAEVVKTFGISVAEVVNGLLILTFVGKHSPLWR